MKPLGWCLLCRQHFDGVFHFFFSKRPVQVIVLDRAELEYGPVNSLCAFDPMSQQIGIQMVHDLCFFLMTPNNSVFMVLEVSNQVALTPAICPLVKKNWCTHHLLLFGPNVMLVDALIFLSPPNLALGV